MRSSREPFPPNKDYCETIGDFFRINKVITGDIKIKGVIVMSRRKLLGTIVSILLTNRDIFVIITVWRK